MKKWTSAGFGEQLSTYKGIFEIHHIFILLKAGKYQIKEIGVIVAKFLLVLLIKVESLIEINQPRGYMWETKQIFYKDIAIPINRVFYISNIRVL